MPQSPSGDLEDECDEVQIGDKDTVAGRSTWESTRKYLVSK